MCAVYVTHQHTGYSTTTVPCKYDSMESMSAWNKKYIALEITWPMGKGGSKPVERKCRRRGGRYGAEYRTT